MRTSGTGKRPGNCMKSRPIGSGLFPPAPIATSWRMESREGYSELPPPQTPTEAPFAAPQFVRMTGEPRRTLFQISVLNRGKLIRRIVLRDELLRAFTKHDF